MGDSPERTALYRRMARIVVQDAPWLFMSHRLDYNMSHARLRGYRPHDFPYGMEIYYDMEGALP
jgi:ABC-type transport system substrate-binding protein